MKNYIKLKLRESLEYHHVTDATKDEYVMSENINVNDMHFLGGKFKKEGHNIIMHGEEPIVDMGIGKTGMVEIDGNQIPNALYIVDYNASKQGSGYGTLGVKFLFTKLPRIQNLVLQCYDTACPFWTKMGAKEISNKEIKGGNILRTMVINRNDFPLI